jgi:hypothetical protein
MRTLSNELAAFLREWIPTLLRQYEEAGRETVQTVVWLVGLASGLVTLIAVNPKIVASLTTGLRRGLVISLGITITCGVLQRVIYQLAEPKQRQLLFGLECCLAGYTLQVQEPEELEQRWDQREIVLRLARDFDVDYSILDELDISIERYREAYSSQVQIWRHHESERLQWLGQVTAAYSGIPAEKAKQIFQVDQERGDNLAEARGTVGHIRSLQRSSRVLFMGTCAGFLAALLLLAVAIWLSL